MAIISVIVLVVGAVVTISSFSKKKDRPPREARSIRPWEGVFFSELEEPTREVGLAKLETKVVNAGDLEVRYWYDGLPFMIHGVVVRRSGDVWSAVGIRQVRQVWPSPLKQEDLGVPKSGWQEFWKRLTDAGILTMPDADEVKCSSGALDGVQLVVEVLTNHGYRTYHYNNPQLGACAEAKQMMIINGIMEDELNPHAAR